MEMDVHNKCRVCLAEEKEMHYLYSEFDKGITLQYLLSSTTGFQVLEEEKFSPYICQNCTSIVVDFYNLKTIYEENESQVNNSRTTTIMKKNELSCEDQLPDLADTESSEKCSDDYITIKVECLGSDSEESALDVFKSKSEHSYINSNDEYGNSSDMNESYPEVCEGTENCGSQYEYREIHTYTCPECGDCFLYKNEIHAHMLSKHDITEIDYEEISELSLLKVKKDDHISSKIICKICSEQFQNTDVYKEHLETHKKNVCDICGVGFVKKSYLRDHLEVHCNEKRHVCNFCNKAFKRRTVLVKHKRIHTHPRECICEICGKAFNDKGTLKTHIMLLHIRERNYMCLICGVKFPLKATLEKHVRRHQNKEREFFCTQCPLGYRDKSSLDRHIYVKHSGQNVKSTCTDCGKQYTTLSNLFKHQRSCHKIPDSSLNKIE